MFDPIPVLSLLLLLWLVARDLSNKRSRSEPSPLLPQHYNNVCYTIPPHGVEQQSASKHQRQNALSPKVQSVHLEHERAASSEPVQAIPSCVSAFSQEQDQMQTSSLQINEPVPSPVTVPPVPASPVEPRREAVQIHHATEAPVTLDAVGDAPQLLEAEGGGDYVRLRELARQEIETVQKYQREMEQARASGQSKLVQELSEEVEKHRRRRQLFNEQASSLIFAKNNKNGSLDRIDLRNLTATEAVIHASRAINNARENGITRMSFIVGEGLHISGLPVLKSCMLDLMQKLKLPADVDPSNEGVLIVQLIPAGNGSPPGVLVRTPLQHSLPQISPPVQSRTLVPQIHASPTEPDRQTDDSSQEPVQNIQAPWIQPVPTVVEEVSQLPQKSAHSDVKDGSGDPIILREYAKQERKMMLDFRKERKLAQARGQTTLARELAEKECEYEERSETLNAQASELIFANNNKNGSLDWVVLHDLKPKEAKIFTKRVIEEAHEKGKTEIRFVVGEGPCSPDVPPTKPIVAKFLKKKCGLPVEVDAMNKGVLIVKLNPESSLDAAVVAAPSFV